MGETTTSEVEAEVEVKDIVANSGVMVRIAMEGDLRNFLKDLLSEGEEKITDHLRFDTRSTRNKSTINNNNNTADSNNSYKRKVEGSSVNNALANINHDGKLIPYESQNTLASLVRMSTFQNNIILKSIGIDNPYVSRSIIRQLIAETVDCVAKKSYKRIQPNFELITMDQKNYQN